jgi:hypothetical protein
MNEILVILTVLMVVFFFVGIALNIPLLIGCAIVAAAGGVFYSVYR